MVGLCESGSHHAVGAFARKADIQQAIPVQVCKFAAPAREANSLLQQPLATTTGQNLIAR